MHHLFNLRVVMNKRLFPFQIFGCEIFFIHIRIELKFLIYHYGPTSILFVNRFDIHVAECMIFGIQLFYFTKMILMCMKVAIYGFH